MSNDLPDWADTLQAFSLGTFAWTQAAPTFVLTGVPAWAQCLLFFSGDGHAITYTVTGGSSQVAAVPWDVNNLSAAVPNQSVPVVPGLDSTFTVDVTTIPTGITTGTITAFASPLLIPSHLPPARLLIGQSDNRTGVAATVTNLINPVNGPIMVFGYDVVAITNAVGFDTIDSITFGHASTGFSGWFYGSDAGHICEQITKDFRGPDGYGPVLPQETNPTTNGIQFSTQVGMLARVEMLVSVLG